MPFRIHIFDDVLVRADARVYRRSECDRSAIQAGDAVDSLPICMHALSLLESHRRPRIRADSSRTTCIR